jgi:hypothetical protein
MRTRLHHAAVGAALAVALAAAPPAAAQTPAGDSIAGDLFDQRETGIQVFDIDARSGPAGEDPTGTATWHVGGGLGPSWNVDVTCLSVDGNRAVAGFAGTVFFFGMLQPTAGLIRVVDGGGPVSGQDSFEWAEAQGAEGDPPIPGPVDCSTFPSVFGPSIWGGGFNRSGGDLVVTDAKPVPVTKGECTNGGWRSFGVFRNQGDCVSFVATGGKNPPAPGP